MAKGDHAAQNRAFEKWLWKLEADGSTCPGEWPPLLRDLARHAFEAGASFGFGRGFGKAWQKSEEKHGKAS
jgi:hypothetical protein